MKKLAEKVQRLTGKQINRNDSEFLESIAEEFHIRDDDAFLALAIMHVQQKSDMSVLLEDLNDLRRRIQSDRIRWMRVGILTGFFLFGLFLAGLANREKLIGLTTIQPGVKYKISEAPESITLSKNINGAEYHFIWFESQDSPE